MQKKVYIRFWNIIDLFTLENNKGSYPSQDIKDWLSQNSMITSLVKGDSPLFLLNLKPYYINLTLLNAYFTNTWDLGGIF